MTKKNIILAVCIIILLSIAAWYFMKDSNTGNRNSSLTTASKTGSVGIDDQGKQILATLNLVKNINLTTDFLFSQAYKNLKESNVEIVVRPTGRSNPFSPTSFDGSITTTNEQVKPKN